VVWYGGQFYALFFLTQTLKVDGTTANLLIAGALLLATPFFVLFGWLSDRIGRKKIVMAGCLLAALTYFPMFKALTHYANPASRKRAPTPGVVHADPARCSFQFDPVGKKVFTNSCDIATAALAKAGVPYDDAGRPRARGQRDDRWRRSAGFEGAGLSKDEGKAQRCVRTRLKRRWHRRGIRRRRIPRASTSRWCCCCSRCWCCT
jgi:hypothetical protein